MKLFLSLFLFLAASICVQAQILNDSADNAFGFGTVRYALEEDAYRGAVRYYSLDTNITDIHNWGGRFAGSQAFQDLGLIFTAQQPIFPAFRSELATTYGLDIYDRFAYGPSDNRSIYDGGVRKPVRYFDTPSPYSRLVYNQTSLAEARLIADLTRNVTPNWNLGISYSRTTGERQIGVSRNDDRQVDQHAVAANTHYFTRDGRYQLYGYFSHLNHDENPTGGIRPDLGDRRADLFDYDIENVWLYNTNSRQKKNDWHLYHEYRLTNDSAITIFHQFDRRHQVDTYRDRDYIDVTGRGTAAFYTVPVDSAIGEYRFHLDYGLFDNKAGLRTTVGQLAVEAHLRHRSYRWRGEGDAIILEGTEQFVGGKVAYAPEGRWGGTLEADFGTGSRYRAQADLRGAGLHIGLLSTKVSPELFDQKLRTPLYSWDNRFSDIFLQKLTADYQWSKGKFHLKPFGSFEKYSNYVYHDFDATPTQATEELNVMQLGLLGQFKAGWFHLDGTYRYSNVSGADVYRLPAQYLRMKAYYGNQLFDNALETSAGIQLTYMSAYHANAYMPALFHFYLQDAMKVQGYPVFDIFINIRVKRVTAYVMFSHVNQGLGGKGYFVTPFYTAQQRAFQFGFSWQFFD